MITTCYMCGMEFTPDPELVKRWAESDKPYEPTDWECEVCNWLLGEDCMSAPDHEWWEELCDSLQHLAP